MNNHNSTVFKVDNHTILDHAYFIGLYLAVLDRRTLKLEWSEFYNTTTVPYLHEFGYNSTGPWNLKGNYSVIDDFVISRTMAEKIREYDYNYFIVVLSNYAWEPFFSKELGEALHHCGALNIAEMTYHFSPRFGNGTTFEDIYNKSKYTRTNKYHPYAFVGIPGLSPGQGYERLRSN